MKVRVFFVSLLAASGLALSGYYAWANQKPALLQEAIQGKGAADVIRSLVEKMSGELEKDYERFPELIREVESFTQSQSDSATIALLHSLTAQMYQSYYNSNRMNIQGRTDLQGYIPEDIREWTSNLFTQKIKEELDASLSSAKTLQETPTTRFADVLKLGEDARMLRPTLYDFLLQRAIELQPSADYYQRWIAFRAAQTGNPKAELLVALDYLRYRLGPIHTDVYKAGLDSLAEKFPEKECQLEIDLAKLQWMQAMQYDFQEEAQRDSARQAIYAFCEERLTQYTKGMLRANEFRNTLMGMSLPTLRVQNNSNVYPGKNLELNVTYRNTPTLKVRIYQNLSRPEVTMRKQKGFRGKLVKEVDYSFSIAKPYEEADTLLAIPMEQLGLYEYEVTVPGEDLKVGAPFSVSRLAALCRTNPKGVQEILVTDFESGKPLADVPVVCYNVSNQWISKVIGEVRTDADGLASLTIPNRKQIDAIRPVLEGDTASLVTSLSPVYPDVAEESDLTVYLFTDRGIYRPGQTIAFKGIIYNEEGDDLQARPGLKYTVILRDANYQEIDRKEFVTNEFGSFHGEFTLPKQTLNGNFTLTSEHTSTHFRVEEYKRPSFQVEIEPLKEEVAFGKEILLKGKAQSFSGVALQEGKVTWTIQRQPFWLRSYMPSDYGYKQVANGEAEVDKEGNFLIRFTPERENDGAKPVFRSYQVQAFLTDSKGETQEAAYVFSVGDAGIVLSFDMENQLEKEKASARIMAQTINGEKVSAQGTYTISRQWEGKPDSICSVGHFTTEKPLDNTHFASLPSGKYRLQVRSMDKQGVQVESEQEFLLYSLSDARPPVEMPVWMPQNWVEAEVGKTAHVLFGTSEKPAYVLYELFSERGDLLHRERFTMADENHSFAIPFLDSYERGVTASFLFVKEGEVYRGTCRVQRKVKERQLTFRTETFRDHLLPGSEETWKFRLLDKDSLAVRAEVLASMYDASLDELMPFDWYFQPMVHTSFWTPYFREGWAFQRGFDSDAGKRDYLSTPSYAYDAMYADWNKMLYQNLRFYNSRVFATTGSVQLRGAMAKAEATEARAEVFNMVEDNAVLAEPPAVAQDIAVEAEIQPSGSPQIPVLRENFQETAFFYPVLRTDEQGEVAFHFTVPESNTTWKLQLLAHTDSMEYGYLSKEVVTSKPLMVQPNLPRFLREGDEVSIASQLVNQLASEVRGNLSFELFNPENEEVLARMEKPFVLASDSVGSLTWCFQVGDWSKLGVVGCRIVAESAEGSDGEQHLLPVLSDEVLLTESVPFFLMEESGVKMKLPKQAIENPYRVTLEVSTNPVWYAIQALSTLNEPEQEDILSWFSVYYSNVLSQYVAQAHPRIRQLITQWNAAGGDAGTLLSNLEKNEELKTILLEETPWVMEARDETEQKQRLELLFDMNRAEQVRAEAFHQLLERQTVEGGWSWMKGMPSSFSMTVQILKGMAQLVQLGAVQYEEAEKEMQMRALRFLDTSLKEDYEQLLRSGMKENVRPSEEQIEYLFVRSFYRDIPEGDAREAIRFYTSQAEQHWEEYGLYGRAAIAWLMQANGNKAKASEILAWFRKTATTDKEKGMYWANNRASYASLYQPVETHCLLMALFHWMEPNAQEADRMKQWLLVQKRTQHWASVPATQNAVYALLLTGSDWLSEEGTVQVENGKETIHIDTPYRKQELTAVHVPLSIEKTGDAPVWGAVYVQYFAPIREVKKQKGVLNVEKRIFQEVNTSEGKQLRPVSEGEPLQVGDKVMVRLTIRTDRRMDYVFLKDLRAASFEPAEVLSSSQYRDGVWYYRSSKDVSEHIYIEHLPQGTFVLEYPLYVARSGRYASGMATIQCLYAPEFVSHTEGGTVVIP